MLNTKDIPSQGEGKLPKILQPGNRAITIHKVELEDFKFKPGALEVVLHCEGEDQGEDFEGFFIDKDNESLGRHKGQVGRVKAGEWAFADGETRSGIVISRDADMLKFLKSLCTELNCLEWLENEDGKHSTIQSLYKKFDEDKPFKGKWLNTCLGGKEYLNKEGYPNYSLFFPKFSKAGVPFEAAGKTNSKLVTYDEKEHIRKKKVENVENFTGNDTSETKKGFKL